MKEMKQVITMTNQKIIDFQKEKQKKEKIEIESNNLYEINKNLISQSSPLSQEEINDKIDSVIIPFFWKNINQKLNIEDSDCTYFMLLCREANDYTLFNFRLYLDYKEPLIIAGDEIYTCMKNRGQVYSIEKTKDNYAVEIWLNHKEYGLVCYYLFPYDEGVIEI